MCSCCCVERVKDGRDPPAKRGPTKVLYQVVMREWVAQGGPCSPGVDLQCSNRRPIHEQRPVDFLLRGDIHGHPCTFLRCADTRCGARIGVAGVVLSKRFMRAITPRLVVDHRLFLLWLGRYLELMTYAYVQRHRQRLVTPELWYCDSLNE